jgi:hypothetical protein
MAGPVVDTASAQEFQREALSRISSEELAAIAATLEAKSQALRTVFAGSAPTDVTGMREVLRRVAKIRRRADQILDSVRTQRLAAAIDDLLDHDADLPSRIDRFDAVLADFPGPRFDLPGELLHFTYPDRYWLWSRWMWDPRTRTGALALVTTEDVDLDAGTSRGETYLVVGRATAFVTETGRAAGFIGSTPGLFSTDVFMAAVYGVYMYTVLQMRMTQEFNRLVPPLPDLIRRLLGVYYLEA